jgi:hypothetical protein
MLFTPYRITCNTVLRVNSCYYASSVLVAKLTVITIRPANVTIVCEWAEWSVIITIPKICTANFPYMLSGELPLKENNDVGNLATGSVQLYNLANRT